MALPFNSRCTVLLPIGADVQDVRKRMKAENGERATRRTENECILTSNPAKIPVPNGAPGELTQRVISICVEAPPE
jgi:hypothetical protein